MDGSYNLLIETEWILWRRLAVFAGSFTLEAAEAVSVRDIDGTGRTPFFSVALPALLARLNSKALVMVQRQGETVRYHLPESLRQAACEKLQAAAETKTMKDRHLAYFLKFAETSVSKWLGAERMLWLARLEAEHANLRAALQWAIGHSGAEAALRLSGALWPFWYACQDFTEGRHWLAQALALAVSAPARGQQTAMRARNAALDGAGGLAYAQGDYAQAQQFYAELLRLRQAMDDPGGIAIALNNLEIVARHVGDDAQAAELLQQRVMQRRAMGNPLSLAYPLNRLGSVTRDQDDDAHATHFYGQSLVL